MTIDNETLSHSLCNSLFETDGTVCGDGVSYDSMCSSSELNGAEPVRIMRERNMGRCIDEEVLGSVTRTNRIDLGTSRGSRDTRHMMTRHDTPMTVQVRFRVDYTPFFSRALH